MCQQKSLNCVFQSRFCIDILMFLLLRGLRRRNKPFGFDHLRKFILQLRTYFILLSFLSLFLPSLPPFLLSVFLFADMTRLRHQHLEKLWENTLKVIRKTIKDILVVVQLSQTAS